MKAEKRELETKAAMFLTQRPAIDSIWLTDSGNIHTSEKEAKYDAMLSKEDYHKFSRHTGAVFNVRAGSSGMIHT